MEQLQQIKIKNLKECKPFGNSGGHIVLNKEDVGKKFLLLTESSKYILAKLLEQYQNQFEELVNPKLHNFLNEKDFKTIKQKYLELIEEKSKQRGLFVLQHKAFLESDYNNLENFRLKDIGIVIQDIERKLPEKLKNKLLGEYYRLNPID